MNYAAIYDAATADSTLKKQIAVALVKASTDIVNEDAATKDHSQRLALARRLIGNPTEWAERLVWKVLENATIQSAPDEATDNDVQFVVNSLIPSFMTV